MDMAYSQRRSVSLLEDFGAPYLDRTLDARMEGPRPDVRGEGPNQVANLLHFAVPADHQVPIRDFRSVTCTKTILLGERDRTRGKRKQNLYYSFSSEPREQFGEFAAG